MHSNDRVLVTGSTGLVGYNLLRTLKEQGMTQLFATVHSKLPKRQCLEEVMYIPADLTERVQCDVVVKDMDYIFHCAANTSGASVMNATPLVHVTPNILMNLHLFEAAYESDVKKIAWLSSGSVYPSVNGIAKEEDAFSAPPFSKYFAVAHMKRYTEVLAELFSFYLPKKLPIVVVRPTNIYGPYDKFDPEKSHVTAALIRKVIKRYDPLEVWGTGTEVRDLIYIDDFIEGLLLAFETLDTYDPINIGSGILYTVQDILTTLLQLENFTPQIVYNTNKPTTIDKMSIDVTKAADLLGFNAETTLEMGLQKTLSWFRENESWL